MARITPLDRAEATGKANALLDDLADRGGEPGTMVRTMAQAPALLRGYLDLNRAMKRTHLDRRISETGGFNLVAGIHPSSLSKAGA